MSPRDPDFAFLAHDLSQLLWAIQGRARTLAQRSDSELAAGLHLIADDAAAAADMLADDPAGTCASDQALDSAWRQSVDRAGGGPAWRLQRDGAWPTIEAPAHAVRRILANLLANALDACPHGGTVTCVGTVNSDRWRAVIRDEGPGIPDALKDRLFETGATAGKTHGHGLGLSGARTLARRYGGDLEHISGSIGAAFAVTFPVAEQPVAAESVAPAAHGVRPARILVVDDEPGVRLMLQDMLDLDGHRVELAADHQSALALFQPGAYDAVLVDLGLPGRSGLEVAQDLRAQDAAVSLILLSGWGRESELAAADPAVADDTGLKPIDQPELRALLARAVERTAARRNDAPEA